MPCYGLCLARVHMSEHDFLLYLFIFLFRELSPFSFLVDLPQVIPSVLWLSYSASLYLSVTSCPWESYRMVFDRHTHTCMCAHGSELFKARGHFDSTVYTLSLLCVCTHSLILFISGCRRAPTGPHSNALPGSVAGCPQNGDDPHYHVGHFFSRLACDGKEGFWLLENTATEDLYSPYPFSHHTKKCCETASLHKSKVPSPHSHPPQPIEIGKSGPS